LSASLLTVAIDSNFNATCRMVLIRVATFFGNLTRYKKWGLSTFQPDTETWRCFAVTAVAANPHLWDRSDVNTLQRGRRPDSLQCVR